MNSNGTDLLAEDKEGKTLIPGNHIYKYNKDGKRLNDFRSQFGKQFFIATKGLDTLLILKGIDVYKRQIYDCHTDPYFSPINGKCAYGKDRLYINFLINFELHQEQFNSILKLPNPYEPLLYLFERGSGNIFDRYGGFEFHLANTINVKALIAEMNIEKQEVILDHDWLDWVDEHPD